MNLLPPIARELVALLGYRNAIAFCRAAGGTDVCVPRRADADCRLVRMIGQSSAASLVQKYPGKQLKIPILSAMTKADRDAEIVRMHAEGTAQVQIARSFGLTPRQVQNILKAKK